MFRHSYEITSIVLYVIICQLYSGNMFGLPDITIIAVGGVVLVVIAALLYWGLTFRGHD
jgi:hypothetical protein